MKTFFWTSVAWILALGAFWLAGPYSVYVEGIWREVIPQDIKMNIRTEGYDRCVLDQNEEKSQNSDALSGETVDSELLTWEVLSGAVEELTGAVATSGNANSEPEFIVTVEDDTPPSAENQTGIAVNASSQKEIEELQARVDALEYHLLMLMQSLQQPKGQPKAIPMQYPVWNYSLTSAVQN